MRQKGRSSAAPSAAVSWAGGNGVAAMRIIKEGGGYSDQEMFQAMRFDILVRKSVGLMSLEDKVPTESTYYNFFGAICEYRARTGIDLYEEACRQVTKKQIEEYNISGRKVRMDSTLIGSDIAHYSRYRIVHATLAKAVRMPGGGVSSAFSDSVAARLKSVLDENAEHTCYELNAADMRKRFLELGLLVQQVLAEARAARTLFACKARTSRPPCSSSPSTPATTRHATEA